MKYLPQSTRVAVIGAGIMGSGIAQLAATAGHEVALFDADQEQLARGRVQIEASLKKLVSKGALEEPDGVRALQRLHPRSSVIEAADGADLVIEAVVERLPVKQAILAEAAGVASPTALLATNTSQLSITAIGSALPDASDRVVGMHFFNPAVLMRLVEIVAGLETSDATIAAAKAFAESLGKETVVCRKDSPRLPDVAHRGHRATGVHAHARRGRRHRRGHRPRPATRPQLPHRTAGTRRSQRA